MLNENIKQKFKKLERVCLCNAKTRERVEGRIHDMEFLEKRIKRARRICLITLGAAVAITVIVFLVGLWD